MAFLNVPNQYSTISAAMAATLDGDTINVETGYSGNETIIVNSNDIGVNFYIGAENVVFQLGPRVIKFDTFGSSVKIIGNSNSNSIEIANGNAVVEGLTGSDLIKSYGGDDNISLNIDGDDYIEVGSGNNIVTFNGGSGSGGALWGSGNGYTTAKASNLGEFAFHFVNKLDTKDVLARVDQISSFERIEDSTAPVTAIAIRLRGEGGLVDVTTRVTGTDSVQFIDAGLTGRVSQVATAFNDLLGGSAFDDTLAGGNGDDAYVFNDAGDTINEFAGFGIDSVEASIDCTLAANVEHLTLVGAGPIDGTGNDLANRIVGNAAANLLDGRAGADTMSGGGGSDIYIVDSASDLVVETLNAGTDLVRASATSTLSDDVEDITLTGAEGINAIGNGLANTLTGNSAVNALTGHEGDDTYIVQNTGDIVVELAGQGDDVVRSEASFTLGDHVEALVLLGGSTDATGNDLANDLTGNGGANALNGRGGADVMAGLAGGDTYFVDVRNDRTVELANEGADTVRSVVNWTLAANIENLTLLGTASTATGNALANTLKGNSARNSLDGGAGKDELLGGAGADSFLFTKKPSKSNVETIVDFSAADAITLDNAAFKGLGAGRLSASEFEAIDSLSEQVDSSERILYDRDTGALYFDRNGGGRDLRVKVADLQNEAALNHLDFQVI